MGIWLVVTERFSSRPGESIRAELTGHRVARIVHHRDGAQHPFAAPTATGRLTGTPTLSSDVDAVSLGINRSLNGGACRRSPARQAQGQPRERR